MKFKIGNREIGDGTSCFVIAELSANHLQKYDLATDTIKAAKKAGADAVKLQTYTADTLTIDVKNEYFTINNGTPWDGRTFHELYQEAFTPWDWQPKLKKLTEELGMICFSSPFDKTAVDFLNEMNVPAYKVASFEIVDIPLIEYIAKQNKPVIFSSGIATEDDIKLAIDTCKKAGNNDVAVLKCSSSYPAPLEELNLMTIPDLAKKYNVVSGLSDHSLTVSVPIAAVSLGAKIIEKHLILDRNMGGPDSKFSLEPEEFKQMVDGVREAEKAIGNVSYKLSETAKANKIFARSLFAVKDIKNGELFTENNIRSIRPGVGLHPKYLKKLLGKPSKKTLKRGEPLTEDLL